MIILMDSISFSIFAIPSFGASCFSRLSPVCDLSELIGIAAKTSRYLNFSQAAIKGEGVFFSPIPITYIPASLKRCLLYTSDAADEEDSVDLGGRRVIKKKK